MLSHRPVALLYTACLLFGACGKTHLFDTGTGGGGTSTSGGATGLSTGGSAGRASAGASGTAMVGGSINAASGGSGGASPSGGSSGVRSCDGTCDSLPASCKKVIQAVGACCPTCADTGCSPCADVACAAGTHKETLPAACCASCVPDPPDPCLKGQQDYSAVRTQMLDKYGSVGCRNSSDCTLVLEDNACAAVCNVPVPTSMVVTLLSNLRSSAASYCGGCPTPAAVLCEPMLPACMNGRCVAANPP